LQPRCSPPGRNPRGGLPGIGLGQRGPVHHGKLIDLGGKVVTLSDSNGYIYDEKGIDREKLAYVKELKNVRRGA
jgi:glutamate dehydrogenase/leucine dehydrogenase